MSKSHIFMSDNNHALEAVQEGVQCTYISETIKLGTENQTAEMSRQIGLIWTEVQKFGHILKETKIPIYIEA